MAKRLVVVSADQRAGAASAEGLPVALRPIGLRCNGCVLPDPSTFALRTGGRHAAVRVYLGAAWLEAGGQRLPARAGQEAFVDCRGGPCAISLRRVFHPGEPFRVFPRRRRVLARTLPGPQPPPRPLLAPERSLVHVVAAPAERPAYLGVVWVRAVRGGAGVQRGLIVWLRDGRVWRRAYTRRHPFQMGPRAKAADVTRDGLPELLVTEWNGGTGYCGVRRVLTMSGGSVREIFRRGMCETDLTAMDGDLSAPEPIGPCPVQPGSVHCFGGIRHERLRWNGRRFVRVRTWVACHARHLDPARGCGPRSG